MASPSSSLFSCSMDFSKYSSTTTTTLKIMWCKLPWLLILFLISATFSSNSVSSRSAVTQISYSDHCASIVPEPTQEIFFHYTNFSFSKHSGFYKGGSNILSQNSSIDAEAPIISLEFRLWSVQAAEHVQGLFKITGYMLFNIDTTYYHVRNYSHSEQSYYSGGSLYYQNPEYSPPRGPIRFRLHGFWSESSGKLCMVGSSHAHFGEGNFLSLPAVLKLYNLKSSTTFSELITGTLESLSENDPGFFEPVSIMLIQRMNYRYTLVSDEQQVINFGDHSDDLPSGLPLTSFPRNNFCSLFSKAVSVFNLRYSSHCSFSAKNCTPFGLDANYLPSVASFNEIECSQDKQKLRAIIKFPLSRDEEPFNANTTLVGEGIWDSKKNQLYIVACRFLNATENSYADARVADCSTQLSLRYQSIWKIGNSKTIVGQIWSNKTVTEFGYFDKIRIEAAYQDLPMEVSGLKYEYTKVEKASKLCHGKKKKNKEEAIYPHPFSQDMSFDLFLLERSSKRLMAWGYSNPLFVGNQHYNQFSYPRPFFNLTSAIVAPINLSYQLGITLLSDVKLSNGVSIFNMSLRSTSNVDISAEGMYDYPTGRLCMIGCRNPGLRSQLPTDSIGSVDCEIRIEFQFSPRHSRNNSGYIEGTIESTRSKSDPLYFEPLDLSSSAYATTIVDEQVSRMDVEIIMVLISTTLACVLLGLQHFHLKRNPDLSPFMSLFMLSILTLGYMIPLMLNFEALFMKSTNHQNLLLENGGWFEANEVIVRVMTMIAFLLQFRLLQLTWSARSSTSSHNGIQNESWVAEKEAMFVALPLYAGGALLTMFVTWRKSDYDHVLLTSSLSSYQEHRVWDALKSYSGLVLDGFLLPQILLNILRNARENALSCSFYIGTTFVRLLPHAYDLYTAQTSAAHYTDRSYIFVNPTADFYSTTWDVVISFGGLLFALIVFLQQRFGGRCILTCTFRGQKVPNVRPEGTLNKV